MKPGGASKFFSWTYAWVVLTVFYFPVLCLLIASLSSRRYFSFPYPLEQITLRWYDTALNSAQVMELVVTSVKIALVTTAISLFIGFFAALAYARHAWKGRKLFQKLVLLPLFLPQSVLGLALLMWFTQLGVETNWFTAAIAHTVWICPIATLIMAIRAYSLDASLEEAARDLGASRWQVLTKITLPLMMPGVVSAACFCILLSWGNFALSLFTTGADSSLPEWLYSRMTSAYQPTIPAIGVLSVLAAILLLLAFFAGGKILRFLGVARHMYIREA